ncbi:MAG: hypothetical protein JRI49_03945 [Deltaproteobacteria bacterium]|nr:hypothetical protein [Deltaproteobacteria bacterium]
MKKRSKLTSAIAGAIMAHIRTEEEARAKMLAGTRAGIASLWGVSARQDTMQLSKLYQLRLTGK